MEIRNNSEALKTFLGVSGLDSVATHPKQRTESVSTQDMAGDRATFSRAASEASHSAADAEVRTERVMEIQKALAAGTYSIPASKVADKVIDAMLPGSFGSGE